MFKTGLVMVAASMALATLPAAAGETNSAGPSGERGVLVAQADPAAGARLSAPRAVLATIQATPKPPEGNH